MKLIEIFIFFLLELISFRWFKELFRAAGNYMFGHKHIKVGKLQAHKGLPAAFTQWTDTLPLGVKAPGDSATLEGDSTPAREPTKQYQKWVEFSKNPYLMANIDNIIHAYIYASHFDPSQFRAPRRDKLVHKAVPSIK